MKTFIETQSLAPVVVGPEEDRAPHPIRVGGHEVLIKLRGCDTGGNFAVGLLKAPPMSGPSLHLHTCEDEWFYILKGEFTFQVGERTLTAGPGTSVFAPRNLQHTWQNCTTDLAEALVLVTPAQLEEFFLQTARGSQDPATMEQLFKRYGLLALGPPLSR